MLNISSRRPINTRTFYNTTDILSGHYEKYNTTKSTQKNFFDTTHA